MIQDYAASELGASALVGRELLATAATALLFPFGLRRSARVTPRAAQQRTVVLVHGYLANRSSFLPLTAYLRAHGMAAPLAYDYHSAAGIEQAAIGLKDFLRRRVRGGRIDLVCHSLGGLIARVYLQELGGARRVDQCITLGTPHLGTYNAYWVPSRVGRELKPDSPLLARLAASRPQAAAVRFLSVVAGADNTVIPRVFAADRDDVLHVPDLGHLGLLFSPTVFRAVLERLRPLSSAAGRRGA